MYCPVWHRSSLRRKANTLYYYVVANVGVDGKPRIVHQTYLGTAERVAALVKDRTAPLPLSATSIDYGLPGYIHKQALSAWPGLTIEQLLEQLQQIEQYTLLYSSQGDKGPNRVATVLHCRPKAP